MPCVLLADSPREPDDRAACYLVREWSGAWRTTVVSRRTPELHDVIAGANCVVSSRLHPALLAVPPECQRSRRAPLGRLGSRNCLTTPLPER